MADVAYVNGWVGPLEQARVAVQDRGFLLGDGVYEVMRTYGGRIFEFDAHLDRLDQSLRRVRIRRPMARRALRDVVLELHRRSGYRDVRIYVQVTRGVAPRQHGFPRRARPTLVVWAEKIPAVKAAFAVRGVRVVTVADFRWGRCDIKAVGLLANVLAKQHALEAGAHDAVFVGADGAVREASTANVFIVRGKTLQTHPLGREILPGVSRGVVLEIARAAGIRVRETRFRFGTLRTADEVFLSSTMQQVLPVVRVDGHRIGTGRPGPVVMQLQALFAARAARTAAPGRSALRRPRRGS